MQLAGNSAVHARHCLRCCSSTAVALQQQSASIVGARSHDLRKATPPHERLLIANVCQLFCSAQLGTEISQAEAKEAIRILDSSNTGYIQFADFVEWYMGTKPSREAKDAASTQSV